MGITELSALWKTYQHTVLRLFLLEFLQGCAMLWMAAAMTRLIEAVLAEQNVEAAPIFPALLFSMLCRCLLGYLATEEAGRLSLAVQADCREKLHRTLCGTPSHPIESGRLLTLALETVESFDDLFRQVLPNLISCLVLLPMLLLLMFLMDPKTAGLFLVTLPIAPFLLYLIGQVTKERNAEAWRAQENLNEGFHDFLRGIVTLNLFGRLGTALQKLRALSDRSAEAALRVLQIAFLSAFALELFTTLSIALAAVSVGLRLLSGSLDFFTAFFALLLAPEFYRPIRRGGASFHAGMKAKEAADALQKFYGRAEPDRKGHSEETRMPPEITAEGLGFTYPGQLSPVLQGLRFSLEAGTVTVLAGTSGSGKSTLLSLAAGLAEPTEGGIFLNGLPLSRIAGRSLYRHTAYVPQEPYIFRASLRDNLTLFRETEEHRLWEVLEEAGLAGWAGNLPLGLETELGGLQGNGLSNGQLHRLGFARILLQEPYFALLDEVTAGLDEAGEQQMLRALERFCHRRTVLMTAHRKAVLEWAPRILLLDAGKLVAEGTYETLREVLP